MKKGECCFAEYKKMYTTLFNAITDAIGILQKAQQATEELYISENQSNLTVLKQGDTDSNKDSRN